MRDLRAHLRTGVLPPMEAPPDDTADRWWRVRVYGFAIIATVLSVAFVLGSGGLHG